MKSTFQQIMHLYFLRATNSEQCAALVLNTKLLGLLSNNNKKNKNGLTEKLNEIWKKKNRNRTTDIYYTGKTNRALMRHELQVWMLLIGNKRKEFLFLCLAWWGCLIKWVAWIVKKRAGVKKKKKNLQCVTIKQLWQAYNLSHQLFAFLGEHGRPMQVADAAASVYALHDVCYVFRTIFHSYASLITRKFWDIH